METPSASGPAAQTAPLSARTSSASSTEGARPQRDQNGGFTSDLRASLGEKESITEVPSRLTNQRLPHDYRPGKTTPARRYRPDASIVLIGIRGTGMSTLAVMASSTLGFKLVDADHYFYRATKLSRGAYKATHGAETYRAEELKLIRSMLVDHPSKAVIVCGPGVVEATCQAWLTEYARTHPIIYVMRDADRIQQHLRVWDSDTITRLARLSGPTYRTLSNFEFYNLSDPFPENASGPSSSQGRQSPRSLALKQVQADFLELIYGITTQDGRQVEYEPRHSHSRRPFETRLYTYALSIPLSTEESVLYKLRSVDTVADAVELIVSPPWPAAAAAFSFDNELANCITRQFYLLRRSTRLPIIYHVPMESLSPSFDASRQSEHQSIYLDILHHGLRLSPDYLAVDLRCRDDNITNLVAAKGSTKIIGHFFDPRPPTNGWESRSRIDIVRRAEKLGCALVRITQVATSKTDNFSAHKFLQDIRNSKTHRIPVIAYNTGQLGRTSCVFNNILSPVTHPLLLPSPTELPSPALLTIQEAQHALYSSFILDPMYFGIYGSNVEKSLSPAMHNAAFHFSSMPHRYDIFQHQSLDELKRMMLDPQFGGSSVSAPFKRDMTFLVDKMSPEAQAIGAVNTLIPIRSFDSDVMLGRIQSGKAVAFYGDNTDWIGIYTCIQRSLSPINTVRGRTTALILGAGGMARAATYALIRMGVRTIFIHNRTVSAAEELVRQFASFTSSGPSLDQSEGESTNRDVPTASLPAARVNLRVISSKKEPWPTDADLPIIVVSCVTTKEVAGECEADTSVPPGWLGSPTGGVAVEVSACLLSSFSVWSILASVYF